MTLVISVWFESEYYKKLALFKLVLSFEGIFFSIFEPLLFLSFFSGLFLSPSVSECIAAEKRT